MFLKESSVHIPLKGEKQNQPFPRPQHSSKFLLKFFIKAKSTSFQDQDQFWHVLIN